MGMTLKQIDAVGRLWDATDEFLADSRENQGPCTKHADMSLASPADLLESDLCEECKSELEKARDAMMAAFPEKHPVRLA